ncbi:APC family permease [Streptomyces sp. NPDC048416]|uniref:APC family permease n=1 Tax=Streptomyces sp. NPDC048416 TaxID=3365546 RepID=UPI00371A5400
MAASVLRRHIGVPGLVVHYLTSVLGVGLLVIPVLAWTTAGPLSLLAWAVLILYSYPFALVFARLSTLHPTSKGVAQFVEVAFGRRAGRVAALYLLMTLLAANPVLGLIAGRYLVAALAPGASNRTSLAAGAVVILACVALNLLGVRISGRVQLAVLVVVTGALCAVMVLALPRGSTAGLTPVAPHGWSALGDSLLICFFGFIGWENAAPIAEEVRDPARTFPRGILCAVCVVGVLYFAMALTVALTLPSGQNTEEGLTGFTRLVRTALGGDHTTAAYLVASVLLVLTTNAWCLGTSRVVFALAREGIVPRGLSRISPRTGTPSRAVLALVPGYSLTLGLLAATDSNESVLIKASSAAYLLVFLLAFLSAVRLVRTGPMRWTNYLVAAVTVLMLPFMGVSVGYAAAMFAVAMLVESWLTRRERGRAHGATTPRAHAGRTPPRAPQDTPHDTPPQHHHPSDHHPSDHHPRDLHPRHNEPRHDQPRHDQPRHDQRER